MKGLNVRFPHSRQDSGQQPKVQENIQSTQINKQVLENSLIAQWNSQNKQPSTPLSQAVFQLSSTQAIAPSGQHSKKSSVSSTQGQASFQTPTHVSVKAKRPEGVTQQNYYNKQNPVMTYQNQSVQPVFNQNSTYMQKVNNYLKENSQNIVQQFQSMQPMESSHQSKPCTQIIIPNSYIKQQQSEDKQQGAMSFLNYLRIKEMHIESSQQKKKTAEEEKQKQRTQASTIQTSTAQSSIQQSQEKVKPQDNNLKNTFNILYVIGIGGFGKVWKVENRKNNQIFAMKEMSKALIITKKSVNSVMNERTILSTLKHPFLVNMYFAFQDRDNLYLVLDYMQGGDLRYHVGRMRRFNEDQTKFFMACIFLGLEHIHNNNIIHRDIKPENLVLDNFGYARITDMGIARIMRPENAQDTSGTPGYMAPEVMCRQNHTFTVDYFALGVIGYEFMMGRRPYVGRSRKEIRDQILAKQVQIKKSDIPDDWSLEAADFINRLIQRKPANRLGFSGPHELKLHAWFKNFPWSKLVSKELKSPFIPDQKDDNFDAKQISIEDDENNELIQQNSLMLRRNSIQSLFGEYDFSSQSSIQTEINERTIKKNICQVAKQQSIILK